MVSELAKKLLQIFSKPATPKEEIFGAEYLEAVLPNIRKADFPDAIIELSLLARSREFAYAKAAADAAHQLLVTKPVKDLPKLEQALRQRSPYSGDFLQAWSKISPLELSLLERFGDASVSLLGVASFHWSGYVREGAIRRLSKVKTGTEVPFLILRLNDWVSNVRDAAYKAIRARVRPEYCRALYQNLFLLLRLEYAGRADHTELLRDVHHLLLSKEGRADLFHALHSTDAYVRRGSFKLALRLRDADLKRVAELALDDEDTVIRNMAAQTISSALDEATLAAFVDRMKHDRFMPVRRAALRLMFKLNSPHLGDELHAALLDSHASMREEARYHLKKIEPVDLAEFYRQQLVDAKGPSLYSAISGLGETGRAEDDRLVVPYTSHEASKIRRAALKAVAALRPNAHLDSFMKALEDEVPGVSRQALKTLAAKTSFLSVTRVWEVFQSTTHIHVKRYALLLIASFSKWERISYLVRAGCETDEDIVRISRHAIDVWLGGFNRNFSAPTAEQVAKLNEALETCGEFFDGETQQRLRFSLR
jgi:HEAT repeat protein